jgi:peptidoglycan hydrolase-like protein with peptidoglycan-binding domain
MLNAKLKPSPELSVDSDFGPLTEQAVKEFQKQKKLEATGVVDEKTAKALGMTGAAGFQMITSVYAPGPMAAPAATPTYPSYQPAPSPAPTTANAPPQSWSPPYPTPTYSTSPLRTGAPSTAEMDADQLAALKRQIDDLKKAKDNLEKQMKKLQSPPAR